MMDDTSILDPGYYTAPSVGPTAGSGAGTVSGMPTGIQPDVQPMAGTDTTGPDTAMSVGTGAVSGAAAGSILGPVGAGVGAVVGAIGGLISASDQSSIDKQKAQLEQAQAAQVASREAANDALKAQQTFTKQQDFGSLSAGSGHEGAGIGSQLEIQRQNQVATSIADQEASFQEQMLLAGASMQSQLAGQTTTAGYINAGTSLLGGASKVGGLINAGSQGQTQSLPQPGQGFSA